MSFLKFKLLWLLAKKNISKREDDNEETSF